MSIRPKPVMDFDPNGQATHAGNKRDPSIHVAPPGKQARAFAKDARNPKGPANHKPGSYPKSAQKLRG
jgi:hypothetical protein